MEEILAYFGEIVVNSDTFAQIKQFGATATQYLKYIVLLAFGLLLLSSLNRLLFGKKDQINLAISSAMEVLCIYVIHIAVIVLELPVSQFLTPLPFIDMAEGAVSFFPILSSALPSICEHVLDMLIIAFLVNLINGLFPEGKNIFVWLFLRLISIALALAALFGLHWLLNTYIPQGFAEYAPIILLLTLVALVLLGSLKLLTGAALAFLDPIAAALYTFFFANFIGRALAKAMVTTTLLTGLVAALNALEIRSVCITPALLQSYAPLLAIVLLLWYIVGHLFTKNKKE